MCASFSCSSIAAFSFYLVQDLSERWQAGQLHQVEPSLIQNPAPWFGFYRVQIQRGSTYTHTQTHSHLLLIYSVKRRKGWRKEEEVVEEGFATFNEGEHLGVRDVLCLKVNLQSQQQREQQFVFLIQTPGCVAEHLREDKHALSQFYLP